MPKIIQSYELSGHYMIDENRGDQTGIVSLGDDGKLVGRVQDCNNDGVIPAGPEKLVVGYISPEQQLWFLKLPPLHRPLADVMWALQGREENGTRYFSGGWAILGGMPFGELEFLISANGIPPDDVLMQNIDVEPLKERFFRQDYFQQIYDNAPSAGQSGALELKRI